MGCPCCIVWCCKLMFIVLFDVWRTHKRSMSLRASAHTGVAIPRIFRELSMEETVSFARNRLHF